MLISVTTLLVALSSIFRSRASLELENLALRHQIGVLQRSARKRPGLTPLDRFLWVLLSRVWRLALSAGYCSAGHGHCVAPQGFSSLLDLENPAGPTRKTDGSP